MQIDQGYQIEAHVVSPPDYQIMLLRSERMRL